MPSLGFHAKTGALALIILTAWGAAMLLPYKQRMEDEKRFDITIGVEHASPAALLVSRSTGGNSTVIELGNESTETLFVSVPAGWERDEVRNVPLRTVVSDDPSFGYRRWTLPVNAVVTFHSPDAWRHLTVHNPSGVLLSLRLKTVDLKNASTIEEVYLMKDTPLELTLR